MILNNQLKISKVVRILLQEAQAPIRDKVKVVEIIQLMTTTETKTTVQNYQRIRKLLIK